MKKVLGLFTGLVSVFLFATVIYAEKPVDKGFDEYGYNLTARNFVGTCESWYMGKYDSTKEAADAYCGDYKDDKLVMKWNAEWDRGNDEGWSNPPYAAWENNEWNGMKDGSGSVWHYKIVWVGPQTWDLTGQYNFHIPFSGNDYYYDVDLTQSGDVVTGILNDSYLPAQYPDKDLPLTGTVTGNTFVFEVAYPDTYWGTRTFKGTITAEVLSGTWSDDGTDNATGTWTATGNALLTEGPYWVEGGERIWGQFETIMDQGKDPSYGPGHLWFTKAFPNGYGSVVK